jgi:signal transduction histidine kinase/CheY-like chemotaxis protein
MFASTPCLKDFISPAPSIPASANVAELRSQFSQGNCERVAVVDAHQRPVGAISLARYFACMQSFWEKTPGRETLKTSPKQRRRLAQVRVEGHESGFQQSLQSGQGRWLRAKSPYRNSAPSPVVVEANSSIQELDLLEEVTTLPANLSIEQLCDRQAYRHQIAQWQQTPCFLVDGAGKYLGWLNLPALTAFLAPYYPVQSTKTVSPSPPSESHGWTSFFEQLPIPMVWPGQNHRDWLTNQAWRQEIGELESAESIEKEVLSLLVSPEKSDRKPPSAAQPEQRPINSSPTSSTNRRSGSPANQVQIWEKDNTPKTKHCYLTKDSCICVCSTKNGEEQILRFVKLNHPLAKNLQKSTPSPSSACVERSQNAVGHSPSPAISFEPHRRIDPQPTDEQLAAIDTELPSTAIEEPSTTTQDNTPFCLVMAQDVTEQEHLSQELAAKNRDLVHLNRLKDEFLSCISHELKTPLTAVLGLSSLLKEQTLGKLNDRQLRYAKLIYRSGRHLMGVVNDILDLTRLETGQLELNPEPISVRQVCDRALEQAKQAYKEYQYEQNEQENETGETNQCDQPQVSVEIEPGLETIVADELRLRQMLCYLLTNAYKFTLGGNNTSENPASPNRDRSQSQLATSEVEPPAASEVEPRIGLRVKRRAGWIAFSVWDTGIGIPEDKQHLIFQKFQQIENPLTRQFEGAGLGLVLTQRLTRLHGGEISFISKEGEGSEFTLLLPPQPPAGGEPAGSTTPFVKSQQDSPSREESSHSAQKQPSSNQLLLLVVDASGKNIEDFTNILQSTSEAYQVAIARSGTDALEKARRLQPGLIFLNPLVPLLSGWDVLTLLKSEADTRHIQVVVTGTQAEKEKSAPLADGFLHLPFNREALQEVLAQFLSSPAQPAESPKLTVLQLNIDSDRQYWSEQFQQQHRDWLDRMNGILHQHGCRILEAEDLEQAEVLGRIWQPNAVLLMPCYSVERSANDPPASASPGDGVKSFLQQVTKTNSLGSLPLITLDAYTTQVANQVVGANQDTDMQVFPCLAAEAATSPVADGESATKTASESSFPFPDPKTLLQAIQVATTQSDRRLVAIADISDFATDGSSDSESVEVNRHQHQLQALVQYLDQAGFQGAIAPSWKQLWQQLQCRSIDVLILLSPCTQLASEMHESLVSLEQLQYKPPILVAETTPQVDASTHSLLTAIGDRVLSVTESSPLTLLAEVRNQLGERQQQLNDRTSDSE